MDDINNISSININQNVTFIDTNEIKQQKKKEQYIKALDRIYQLLQINKFTYTKLQLTKPIVEIKGGRSIWRNYSKIYNQIKMNSELVNQYFKALFNYKVSIRNEQMIFFQQRIKSKVIQSYLNEFLKQLICQQCQMADTKIIKDRKNRLIKKVCKICQATCTLKESKFNNFRFL